MSRLILASAEQQLAKQLDQQLLPEYQAVLGSDRHVWGDDGYDAAGHPNARAAAAAAPVDPPLFDLKTRQHQHRAEPVSRVS